MAGFQVLQWIDGNGWLVFSGGSLPGSPIRAMALARASAEGAIAYISLAPDGGDALLDDMEDLGAPAGYMVDIVNEDPETIVEQIRQASVVVVESGERLDPLYHALRGPAVEGIRAAYERGALILVEGLGANLFGRWTVSDEGDVLPGLHWLENSFLEPGVEGSQESHVVQRILAEEPDAIAVTIAQGSALVLDSVGNVEIWGNGGVTISLGKNYA